VTFGFSHLLRLSRAGFVFAREGVLALVDTRPLPVSARALVAFGRLIERPTAKDGSGRLSAALTRLGPTYVKLGQFLATRPDVVGQAIARDLESLQDKMAPFPQADAEATIAAAFGQPVSATFASFGPPVAAASIAQVHKATISARPRDPPTPASRASAGLESAEAQGAKAESGDPGPQSTESAAVDSRLRGNERQRDAPLPQESEAVAVKVLRPGVERRLRSELESFFFAARKAEARSLEAQRLRLVEVVATLARSVAIEMDFRLEAAALSEMAENTRADADFRVPTVDWNRTAREVLTLEWVDGTPLNDHVALAAAGYDLPALGRKVIQSFLRHALRDGFFHADMHPGNLFVDREGRLVAVDFGIMGRLGPKERRFLAEILYGFITRDYHRVAQVHFDAGYVPPHHSVENFAQAIRAIGEPIHNRTAEEISMAKLLQLLFEVTGLFDMRTRPELLLLQKTMVVVEGVGRSFDPRLDMWKTAEPVVREWIERNLGPAGRLEDAAEGAGEIGRFLSQVPGLLTRAAQLADQIDAVTRNGIVLAPETIEALARAERRHDRSRVAALWVIAALLAVVVLVLLFG
jgi:ubiquinone biosynthesis protein